MVFGPTPIASLSANELSQETINHTSNTPQIRAGFIICLIGPATVFRAFAAHYAHGNWEKFQNVEQLTIELPWDHLSKELAAVSASGTKRPKVSPKVHVRKPPISCFIVMNGLYAWSKNLCAFQL